MTFDPLLTLLLVWILTGLALFVWKGPFSPKTKKELAEFGTGVLACALILITAILAMLAL